MPYRKLLPRTKRTPKGTVYVLHFDPPFKHAQHYIGFTTDIDRRLDDHLSGDGANLVKHALMAGCTIRLAVVFPGVDIRFEYQLKNRGSAKRCCPICQGKTT